MSRTVIEINKLGKQYRLGQVGTGTMSDDLKRFIYKVMGKEDPFLKIGEVNDRSTKGGSDYVWALKDIDFKVEQGDVLGVVGKNGAGKSTLLKILSRTTLPSAGEYKIRGRIASLLEVGTGFHPDLSGRENIFLNGAILGMRKSEIKKQFDDIVDFSGVERYIDTPVKRYSSGMYVRLAFAVAAHLEPEILIVDEVLAVGDAEFQKKCLGKMKDVSGQGKTVLFVSHNLGAVNSLCTRAILLDKGRLLYEGSTSSTINKYLALGNVRALNSSAVFTENENENGYFIKADLVNSSGSKTSLVDINEDLYLELEYIIKKNISSGCVCLALIKDGETQFHSYDTDTNQERLQVREPGTYRARLKLPMPLLEGSYYINLSLGTLASTFDYHVEKLGFEVIFKKENPNNYSYSRPAAFGKNRLANFNNKVSMKILISKILGKLNLKLTRIDPDPTRQRKMSMIMLRETLEDAAKVGQSITDYIETTREIVGHTEMEIKKMAELGLFDKDPVILEIGSGTGRYIDHFKRLKKTHKDYIVYELAKDWAIWLEQTYKITRRETEGYSLKYDKNDSVDLLHAHGVFVYVPFLNAIKYYQEMIRVTKPGGKICFDVLTEKCFTDEHLKNWLDGGRDYPLFSSSEYIVNFFAKHNCDLKHEFFMPIGNGITHYLVFEKKQ